MCSPVVYAWACSDLADAAAGVSAWTLTSVKSAPSPSSMRSRVLSCSGDPPVLISDSISGTRASIAEEPPAVAS